jgi:hypothetical protein
VNKGEQALKLWMWDKSKPKEICKYSVEIICHDDDSVRVIVLGGIFHDRENMLKVAKNLEACAAQIKGDLPSVPEQKP